MYVSTFYSFKGGVGRTMALVNVAIDLVQNGRRVVVVDFDLEAPGLDTFDLGRPDETTPGIVDFVESFLIGDRAPDARDFLFESPPVGQQGGRLWVMPSGAQDRHYAQRLTELDWGQIYEHHDGYLLFEDLKEQWRQHLEADYVLIDSRTGYTDVGGICTRQLPNAVILLFFPNQQNLRGLRKIVRDIRAEAEEPREKAIDLHFVLSNVPDLDDEDEILQEIKRDFRNQLGFDRESVTIHRYPSLSLLKQDIFTRDRPRSRLAREYRTLATEMAKLNPEDRDGALEYIRTCRFSRRRRGEEDTVELRIRAIEERHGGDGEVLFRLARWYDRQDAERSSELYDKAIEAGYEAPDAWLERARYRRYRLNDVAGASEDALHVLNSAEADFHNVSMALRLVASKDLNEVPCSKAVLGLETSERIALAAGLTHNLREAELTCALLEPVLAKHDLPERDRDHARGALVLALLALRRFREAADTCRMSAPAIKEMSAQDAFNYGMAVWAEHGTLETEAFDRVLALDAEEGQQGANYAQCLAVAHWATEDIPAARTAATEARERIRAERSSFSCWRYLTVSASEFRKDLDEMRRMIDGDQTAMPQFIRQAST